MCFRETCTHVLVYVLQRETYAVFIDIDLCKDAVSKINLFRIAIIGLLRMPLAKSMFSYIRPCFVKDVPSEINVCVNKALTPRARKEHFHNG
jgi:hypothetical protein